jgi:hypothetical protein
MDENNMDLQFKGLLLPVEHLQSLIDKMDSGVEVAMSDLEKMEVKKYMKMLSSQLFDDDDDDDTELSPEEESRRAEIMKRQLEEAKRKAHKEDVATIKLTEAQRAELEDEMDVAYVRPNPCTNYNKTDDQLYKTVEEKALSDKLNRIRNCYYDAAEWCAVMDIIMEGVDYELKSDKFAYLGSYESRLAAFNAGKLKLQVQLPKLYLNRITPENDPEVLRGIYNGDITVVDRSQLDGIHHKSYKNSELVKLDIPMIGNAEHQYYVQMHRKGFQTPLSGAIKAKSTIYNRYIDNNKNKYDKPFGIVDKNGVPIAYDWLKLGPQEYYRMLHGLKPNMDDIVDNVQKANGGKINKVLGERLNKLMHTDPRGIVAEEKKPNWLSASVQVKPDVVKLEQELLNAIQVTNP